MRAVKKNPRVVRHRWFLKKATLVNFSLPVTIRINPLDSPVALGGTGRYTNNAAGDSTAVLDLGPSLGARTLGLGGAIKATINFNDAFDGGNLGDVKVSIPAQSGYNSTTGAASGIETTSVPLLTSSGVGTQCSNPANFGTLSALPGHSGADDSPGQDDASLLLPSFLPDPKSDTRAPDNLESNLGSGPYSPNAGGGDTAGDTVLRTGNLLVGVPGADTAGTVPGPDGGGNNITTGTSGGVANLFGNDVAGTNSSAVLGVTLATPINSVVRAANPDIAGGLPGAFNCRQSWTGYINNTLKAYLEGSIAINPGLTADGRLRIATVDLKTPAGRESKETLAACLVPFAPFTNALSGDASTVATPPSPALGVVAAYQGASPSFPAGQSATQDQCNSWGPLQEAGAVSQVRNSTGGVDTFTNFSDVYDPSTNKTTTGAAVAISGDLSVKDLRGEVLVGP